MTEIPIEITPGARARRSAGVGTQSRANGVLSWFVLLVLALAPLPLASNRPVVWAAWAMMNGSAATAYVLVLLWRGRDLRYPLSRLTAPLIAVAALCAFMLAQIMPLGPLLAPLNILKDGALLEAHTISVAPGETLLSLARMLTYAIFFFLVLQSASNARRRQFMLRAMLVIIFCYAVYGLLALNQFGDTILGVPKWTYQGSATSTFVNRNSFATYVAFGMAIAAALILSELQAVQQTVPRRADPIVAIYVLALIVLGITELATKSRMGTLVGGAAVLTVIVAAAAARSASGRLIMMMSSMLVVAAAALVFGFGTGLINRYGSTEQDITNRLDLYEQTLQLIAMRPFTGFGAGGFEQAFQLVHAEPLGTHVIWSKAHNTYLTLFTELGVVFGSIPILLLGAVGARMVSGLLRSHSGWSAKAACLGALCAGGLHSLVDFSLEMEANTLTLLAIAALGLAAARADQADR